MTYHELLLSWGLGFMLALLLIVLLERTSSLVFCLCTLAGGFCISVVVGICC